MEGMTQPSLLPGSRATRAEWQRAAADVLRKAGRMRPEEPDELVEALLTSTTLDGIDVPPLGTAATSDSLPDPGLPGCAPYTRGSRAPGPEAGWDIRTHLGDPDPEQAARDAVVDLENGATSLWLSLGSAGIALSELPRVLQEVYLDAAPVVLDCPDSPLAAAEAYAALLTQRGVRPAPGTSLSVDPFSAAMRLRAPATVPATMPATVPATTQTLAELARRWPGTFACTVDGTAVHDVGASEAQELGYTMAVGAALLRVLTGPGRLAVGAAAVLLEFRYAATDEQLTTIAKLRAARRLWHRVLELSGAPDAPGQVQHAVTSRAMTTRYDPWVNMLRGTVAAFAAGAGGATAVTVLPFDSALGIPDALGRRNARNTSSLLISESHVGVVADPAGGSYAVERLTDDLARTGWAELQRIEAEGGVAASLGAAAGGLSQRIRDAKRRRDRQVATRERPITGVSEFPDLTERLPVRRPLPPHAPRADRYGHSFEVLRDQPAATPVFLATLGPPAQHTARATFAANLLAAGGIDTVVSPPTASTEQVVGAYQDAATPVVCLAGTDTAYAERGTEVVAALREAGAAYLALVGEPGERTVAAELVDDSCAVGHDALAFLHRVRDELG